MDHRKTYAIVMVALLVASYAIVTVGNNNDYPVVNEHIDSRYGSFDFEYSDGYFMHPSNERNPDLALASFCLAMAGSGIKGDDYPEADVLPKKTVSDLGFTNYVANEDFTKFPTMNSLGISAAMKKLQDDSTLIVLVFRQAKFGSEWANNFDVGYGDEYGNHEGFKACADKTVDFLNDYIKNNGIKGKIKIWMSGYSRVAGVTNMLTGVLDRSIAEKDPVLNNVSMAKNDIYTYTFESPLTIVPKNGDDVNGGNYDNIWNYRRPGDICTLVPLPSWGFTLYGNVVEYPELPFNTHPPEEWDEFMQLYTSIGGKEERLMTYSYRIVDWEIVQVDDPKYPTLDQELRVFMDAVGKAVETREEYVAFYQDTVESLLDITHGPEDIGKFVDDMINSVITDQDTTFALIVDVLYDDEEGFKEDVRGWVKESFEKNGFDMGRIDEMTEVLWNIVHIIGGVIPYVGEDTEVLVTVLASFGSIDDLHADYRFYYSWLTIDSR